MPRRSFSALPVVPAAAIPTLFDDVAHHIATQAHEACKAGMGMSEFFAWACSYGTGKYGISGVDLANATISAWDDAWGEMRSAELANA